MKEVFLAVGSDDEAVSLIRNDAINNTFHFGASSSTDAKTRAASRCFANRHAESMPAVKFTSLVDEYSA
jgi:hypothetical protein